MFLFDQLLNLEKKITSHVFHTSDAVTKGRSELEAEKLGFISDTCIYNFNVQIQVNLEYKEGQEKGRRTYDETENRYSSSIQFKLSISINQNICQCPGNLILRSVIFNHLTWFTNETAAGITKLVGFDMLTQAKHC